MNLDGKAKRAKAEYMRGYMREWRKRNIDKVRESQQRYWARRAEKLEDEKDDELEVN